MESSQTKYRNMDPDEVDKLDIGEVSDILEKLEIDYGHLENLDEMSALLKHYLMSKRSNNTDTKGKDASKDLTAKSQMMMEEILAKDQKMKEELSDIYTELKEFMDTVGDDLRSVMEEIHGKFEEKLVTYQAELTNNDCPIVVAGETSAGKSSLLNLILGTEVLPHSLLCATSTICRLHNSESKRFEIITDTDEVIKIEVDSNDDPDTQEEKLKEKLKPYVSGTESREQHKYKQVEIYWPIPMLQDQVTIVDTPGVGESDEISKRLFEYLPNAVAFIYVINSANAGGIQEGRLLHILQEQSRWQIEGRLTTFDYNSTIFVCNKWDIVEKRRAEDKVWADTETKLKNALPDFPLSQVFKMSVTEAERYKKSDMGLTTKFKNLLEGIELLVPASLYAKIGRHFKYLEMFLQQLQSKIMSRINHAKKSEEEKNKLYDDVVRRLNRLNADSNRVKDGLINTARSECQMMVNKLHTYLQSDDVKNRLLSWREEDAPDIEADDFEVAKFKADGVIVERILKFLKDWEEENKLVKLASERLTKMFKEECQIISKDYTDVNVVVEGFIDEDLPIALGIAPNGKPNEALFTKSEKVILAVAAPLWVPLVTAASLLFLPVGVGMFIKETIKAGKQRRDYTENKVKYMKEWTTKIMETAFTEDNIASFIFEVYFGNFERKIVELCDEFIPKQIAADQRQVNIIANDRRTSHQILSEFQPLLMKLKMVMGKLRFFELKYMAKDMIAPTDLHIEKEVGKGNFSDVYLATWTNGDKQEKVAMKVLRRKMKGYEMVSQLEEVECLRKFNHKNIVKIYGVCYTSGNGDYGDNQLTMVLEYCDKSLEDLAFSDERLKCKNYKSMSERYQAFKFYVTMATGVCDGLTEMHGKGYLHRDLKLSNVLVKNNTAKLCDLGFARMEAATTGTFVGTMTHMSPELIKHDNYTFSTDIYSLAILLWELWYGHHAYTESDYQGLTTFQLLQAVSTGTRPQLKWKFRPTKELGDVITVCWHEDPQKRPSAQEVGTKLRQMYKGYHNEDI
ncbi:uncharacterized protein LOC132745735 isoform X2 [Ruditapes philippinarum]|nr:uncharacterized protein LOC132745735 isoform X2 [Ruditapes philippinarum]